MTASGELVAFDPDGESLLFVDPALGRVSRAVPCEVTEAHDLLSITRPDGEEVLWVADCGFAMCRHASRDYELEVVRGRRARVVQLRFDGTVLSVLPTPDLAVYRDKRSYYVPTAVAVAPDGDLWVADGYGASLVHRFAPDGSLVATIDGTDGAGRFDCPHGLAIHPLGVAEPELYVADRERGRIQVYALDGRYRRALGEGVLQRPCAIAFTEDRLVVADLSARLTLLELDGTFVAHLGDDPSALDRPGWPNALDPDGHPVRPELGAGRCNSPHSVAAGHDGALYACEWLIGGRLVRFIKTLG